MLHISLLSDVIFKSKEVFVRNAFEIMHNKDHEPELDLQKIYVYRRFENREQDDTGARITGLRRRTIHLDEGVSFIKLYKNNIKIYYLLFK